MGWTTNSILDLRRRTRELEESVASYKTFGFDIASTSSSPASIAFTGDLAGLSAADRMAFIDDLLHVCVVDDGEEAYTLKKSNWLKKSDDTDAKLDGTDGDVMIGVKKLYTRHETVSVGDYTVLSFRASKEPFEEARPTAHKHGDNDSEYLYYGAFKGTLDDSGALRSVYSTSKTPAVNKTIDQFRAAALLNGTNYGINNSTSNTLWRDLYLCAYGNRNSQAALGSGITGMSAAQPVGCAEILTSGMTYGTTENATTHVKGLHMIDPFGNVYEGTDGMVVINGKVYIKKSNNNFVDLNPNGVSITESAAIAAGYEHVTTLPIITSWTYISNVCGVEGAAYLQTEQKGSSTTHWADQGYVNSGTRVQFTGGAWDYGASAGVFRSTLGSTPSYASSAIGARLLMHSV